LQYSGAQGTGATVSPNDRREVLDLIGSLRT